MKKKLLATADGLHAGDMPNIHVPDRGKLQIEVLEHEGGPERGRRRPRHGGLGGAAALD